MRFDFLTAPRIVFGPGTVREAGQIAREFGRRALVVHGRSAERAERIEQLLTRAGVSPAFFSIAGEPDVETVLRGAQVAQNAAADLVVGIGGGSALDAAKAISALATSGGEPLDYLEVIGRGRPLAAAPLPTIAIPTTAGTGSEATKNAVLTSPAHRVKASLRSPMMLPRVAIVDPDLTADLPPRLTAATGLDALTQLVEPFLSCRANPMTDMLAVEGLRRVSGALPRAYHDGGDRDARSDMSFGSLLGGICLANAGLGAVHGFAGALGGLFGAPHGALCAALLPAVLAGNLRAIKTRGSHQAARLRFDGLGPLLTGKPGATASDAIAWVESLVATCAIPPLGASGLTRHDVTTVVEQAGRSSSMKGNPVELSSEEMEAILIAAL